MAGFRYEQLNTNADGTDFNHVENQNFPKVKTIKPIFKTVALISVYFTLSIGLTFYQRWLVKSLNFHLSIVVYHLSFKLLMAASLRCLFPRLGHRANISLGTALRSVAPTGLASGIDVGLSNWGLGLVTMSLYTMTKSTTIVFILGFAIILGLEKRSWSLMMIVIMISSGLSLFTYKSTQFNLLGFLLLILASLCAGVRWTFAQLVMQKYKLGLNNPLEMLYYMQPWMLLSIVPVTIVFEGSNLWAMFSELHLQSSSAIGHIVLLLTIGAMLAFVMELCEYLVVHNTSSLTLSVTGIFKEIVQLIIAVEVNGDTLSMINSFGLFLCLCGIGGHVYHKSRTIKDSQNNLSSNGGDSLKNENEIDRILQKKSGINIKLRTDKNAKTNFPLLNDSENLIQGVQHNYSDESESENEVMDDSDRLIFDILKRRDYVSTSNGQGNK